MRKLFAVIVYTLIMLLIGRNLTILPRFYLFTTEQQEQDKFVTNLKQDVVKIVKSAPGNYGIYFADLNDPEEFGINEKQMFTAASVNKVPIVAVLYYLDRIGKINLNEKITIQKEDIQSYGTGTFGTQQPGSVYSLKTLAKLALKQSDNTAAHVLAKRIGMPFIQKTIDVWGLKQTDMENNQTTTYDMYLLFKKIYNSEITNQAKTVELLGFLTNTDIEDRLPALLPSGTIIYHKTGDALGAVNDVGIVRNGDKVFFIGVLTSDIGDKEAETKQTIAKIAKNIADAYGKRD
jgi:beta-lactamase class A